MKAGLAVFISVLLYASTTFAQGIPPNTTGVAKPPAVFGAPSTFQNTPGAFKQFSKPTAPSVLAVPTTPNADQLKAHQFQQQTKQKKEPEAAAKDRRRQSQDTIKKALDVIESYSTRF